MYIFSFCRIFLSMNQSSICNRTGRDRQLGHWYDGETGNLGTGMMSNATSIGKSWLANLASCSTRDVHVVSAFEEPKYVGACFGLSPDTSEFRLKCAKSVGACFGLSPDASEFRLKCAPGATEKLLCKRAISASNFFCSVEVLSI